MQSDDISTSSTFAKHKLLCIDQTRLGETAGVLQHCVQVFSPTFLANLSLKFLSDSGWPATFFSSEKFNVEFLNNTCDYIFLFFVGHVFSQKLSFSLVGPFILQHFFFKKTFFVFFTPKTLESWNGWATFGSIALHKNKIWNQNVVSDSGHFCTEIVSAVINIFFKCLVLYYYAL